MGCGGSKTNLSWQTREFCTMITSKPSFTKFAYKSDNMKTLVKAIASPVFGGSVFLPVAKKGHARTKKNPLEQEIQALNCEVIYNGGYYVLPNIRESETSQEFLDVYLLASSIRDKELAEKIKMIHDLNNQSLEMLKKKTKDVKKAVKADDKTNQKVFWDEIKEGVTGYVRIVRYTNHSVPNVIDVDDMKHSGSKLINMDPTNLEIDMVEEGSYKNGLKDGYCRVMDARDGSCQVGFFLQGNPMGKYCMYKADGEYILPEGLYEGQGQCKSKIEIANYMQKITRDTKKVDNLDMLPMSTPDIEKKVQKKQSDKTPNVDVGIPTV